MGQTFAAQTEASQTLIDNVVIDDTFEKALLNPNTRFNIVVELQGFLNVAQQNTFGLMPDMGFADMQLPEDPDMVPSVLPQVILMRLSSRPVSWRPDDSLEPNGFAEARLATRSNIESSINITASSTQGGVTNLGSIIVSDKDRYLSPFLKNYNFKGRLARILWGLADGPRKDYRELISSYALNWERNENGQAFLRIQDQNFRLNAPFQSRLFTGSGTLPGTPVLFGRKRPRLIGFRRHVEPIVIDDATGLRMINDGPMQGVLRAFIGGEPAINAGDYPDLLALYAATIPEGGYATCNALGIILPRLALGANSVFTVEAQGDRSFGYTEEIGKLIINEMRRAGINAFEIRQSAFTFMDASAGYWYDGSQEVTTREVVENLAQSGGGRLASDLQFTAIRLQAPEEQPHDDEFTDEEIEQLVFRGVTEDPIVNYRAFYSFNDRVLSENEILLPDQNASLKISLKKPYEIADLSSPLTNFRYASKAALNVVELLLNDAAAAQSFLVARKAFFGVERQLWRCKLPARAMRRQIGSIFKFTTVREKAFEGGRNVLLVANNRQLEGMHSIVHVLV